jgi:hypothetical protein
MTDVIVEVLGGVVQNVAVNKKNVRVVVIDWDNIACAEREEEEPEWTPLADVRSVAPETSRLYQRLLHK